MPHVDDRLLERALAGDFEARSELLEYVRPQIERQLARYAVSEDDRKDLVQVVLLRVFRHLGSFRGDANFTTWLFRVTANEALMLLRSQRRQRARIAADVPWEDVDGSTLGASLAAERDDGSETTLGDAAFASKERETLVRSALADLPDDYRNIVVAHYHLDLGLQEIADRFELTESAVRSRLHRARIYLRDLLDRSGVAEADVTPSAWARRASLRSPGALPASP
ncbi:MAG: sigma-70 family RNA polymerase sigma factor [Polyangiaceae bacterium]